MIQAEVRKLQRSLKELAKIFLVDVEDVYPRLSGRTLSHLEWSLDKLPYWVLIAERYAVKRELTLRLVATTARVHGIHVGQGGEA